MSNQRRMPLLALSDVHKSYGSGAKRTDVLRDVNLRIDDGEFVSIVGYSGAGKTTLISLIAGLIHPDAGSVMFKGEPIAEPGPDRAIVFQNYSLLPWLTVYQNIKLAVDQVFPNWPAAKRRLHAEENIALVNLSPARDKKPRELSGGMRQRVALARALAMQPQVLLLDEPLGALDALTRSTLQEEIERLWRATRKTVVLITNDVDEGILLADRIIPLSAGPAATLGPPVSIDIPRPRDRKSLNHEPVYQDIRRTVLDYLLETGAQNQVSITRKLCLPDIEPEDLSLSRRSSGWRRYPIRRNEVKRETIQVD